jgi:hypothetical protein
MIDQMFDRAYREARTELNGGIQRALTQLSRTVGDGLEALHRLEWNAPWHAPSKGPQVH